MSKKTTYIILAIAILAITGMYFYNKYNVAPSIDVSKLTVVDENDQKFDIASLKGKKVILSFYASWCPPCREELKTLAKIRDQKLSRL
jgi:thiol-disulfide isomerase/thioredoxin